MSGCLSTLTLILAIIDVRLLNYGSLFSSVIPFLNLLELVQNRLVLIGFENLRWRHFADSRIFDKRRFL